MGDVLSGPFVRLVATAGPREGRGHVVRQLALGEALREAGARVELAVMRGAPSAGEEARADRAGIGLAPDTADRGEAAGVQVVDLPDPNEPVRWQAGATVVLDDRNAFAGSADLVVQPSLPAWSGPGRAGRVLEGYDWLALRAEYRRLAADPPPRTDEIVVCFGGSDPDGVTERIVRAVPADLAGRLRVVVGAGHKRPSDSWPVRPMADPAELPTLLARATLALLGAGIMKFEAACLGTPAILLAAADDQLAVGPQFAATGAALWLGDGREIDPVAAWTEVRALLADPGRREAVGRAGRRIVDGLGAVRLAEACLSVAGATADRAAGAPRPGR